MKRSAFLTLAIPIIIFAQEGWVRLYEGLNGWHVLQTNDGGYFIVGWTSDLARYGYDDIFCLKTNAVGDTQWMKIYGTDEHDYAVTGLQNSDGDFVVSGILNYKIFLLKMDELGNEISLNFYGDYFSPWVHTVQETKEGGYMIAGDCASKTFLIITDSAGGLLWCKEYYAEDGYPKASNYAEQTSDGGYIISIKKDVGNYYNDSWLIKTNAVGDTLWTRTYDGQFEGPACVRQTSDNGYILNGAAQGYRTYFIRMDANGDSLWSKTVDGIGSMGSGGKTLIQTQGGDFVMVGTKDESVCILKTDYQASPEWFQTYRPYDDGDGRSFAPTYDGGFIILGMSYIGFQLIKTDSLGRFPLDILTIKVVQPKKGGYVTSILPKAEFQNRSTENYPYPIYCHCKIECPEYPESLYRDSTLIETGLLPWERKELEFAEWSETDTASYIASFWVTDTAGDTLSSEIATVLFSWGGIEEQPLISTSDFEVLSSIGSRIALRFSPSTNPSWVSIFDASGRKIDELEALQAGGTVQWGKGMSPGVYFIVPQDSKERSSKVVLVR